jgi:hypothetical protein
VALNTIKPTLRHMSLALEVTSDKQKWLLLGVYKPPSMRDNIYSDDFNKTTDKIVKMYDHFIIMADMNFNMLDDINNVGTLVIFFVFKIW